MSKPTPKAYRATKSDKIKTIRAYLEIVENTDDYCDEILERLVNIRSLEPAKYNIYQASEVLNAIAAISCDLFSISNQSLDEFERRREYWEI